MAFDIKCTVEICKNTMNTLGQSGEIVYLHPFPKDPELRQQWIKKCGKSGNWSAYFSYVCSEHFTDDDFEPPQEKEPHRKNLLPTAIPTLNLGNEAGLETIEEKSEASSADSVENERTLTAQEEKQNASSAAFVPIETYNDLLKTYERMSHTNECLKRHLRMCRKSVDRSTRQICQLQEQLAESNCKYEMECLDGNRFEQAMKHFFDMAKENFESNTKTVRKWSPEEIIQTLAIRYLSKRCYNYLYDNLKSSVPDMDSLQKWLANINVHEGFLDDYLCVMHIVSKDMDEKDKATVLHFTQIKVTSLYEYDATNDTVLKPRSTALLIVAAGLFTQWKQPIYLSFDGVATQKLVFDLIEKLEHMSYSVVACVSDYNDNVAQLWTELGLKTKRTHFHHPVIQNKVYWFVEAPYLLKNLHYILVTEGFRMNDGHVNVGPLREMLVSKRTGQRYHSKIERIYLTYFEGESPKLKPVKEFFNFNTVLDLKLNYSGTDKSTAAHTATFIETINRWYSVVTTQEYGSSLHEQNILLDVAYDMAAKIVAEGNERVTVLKRAFLLSINSLRKMPFGLWAKYQTIYTIPTVRLCINEAASVFSRNEDEEIKVTTPLNVIIHLKSLTLLESPYRGHYLTGKLLASMPPIQVNVPRYSPAHNVGNVTLMVYSEADEVRGLVSAVAEKFLDTHPQLGTRKRNLTLKPPYLDVSVNMNSFVQPSSAWKTKAKLLNDAFEKFHEELVATQGEIIQSLVGIVQNICPDADLEVVKYFFRERLLLRLKYLNAGLVETARATKEDSDSD